MAQFVRDHVTQNLADCRDRLSPPCEGFHRLGLCLLSSQLLCAVIQDVYIPAVRSLARHKTHPLGRQAEGLRHRAREDMERDIVVLKFFWLVRRFLLLVPIEPSGAYSCFAE